MRGPAPVLNVVSVTAGRTDGRFPKLKENKSPLAACFSLHIETAVRSPQATGCVFPECSAGMRGRGAVTGARGDGQARLPSRQLDDVGENSTGCVLGASGPQEKKLGLVTAHGLPLLPTPPLQVLLSYRLLLVLVWLCQNCLCSCPDRLPFSGSLLMP